MIREQDLLVIKEPPATASERAYIPEILRGMFTTFKHLFRRKRTVQYPEEKAPQRIENYRGLHRLNRDEQGRVACVACFMCSTACPANCIRIVAGEAPWPDREKFPVEFEIDELRCIYCGMCEYACPVDAIELTPLYNAVGRTRADMIYNKEKLLEVYDRTKDTKPRKDPPITGYTGTGHPELCGNRREQQPT